MRMNLPKSKTAISNALYMGHPAKLHDRTVCVFPEIFLDENRIVLLYCACYASSNTRMQRLVNWHLSATERTEPYLDSWLFTSFTYLKIKKIILNQPFNDCSKTNQMSCWKTVVWSCDQEIDCNSWRYLFWYFSCVYITAWQVSVITDNNDTQVNWLAWYARSPIKLIYHQ